MRKTWIAVATTVTAIAGLILGAAFVVPVSATPSPTTATWMCASCPPGPYVVTATATPSTGGAPISADAPISVSLPGPASVTLTWGDLTLGKTFSVRALSTNTTTGQVFSSETISIVGNGSPAPTPTPTPTVTPPPQAIMAITDPTGGASVGSVVDVIVSIGGGIDPLSVRVEIRTLLGAVALASSTPASSSSSRLAFVLRPTTLTNGPYSLVAVSGSMTSQPINVTLTGGVAPNPTPSPSPSPTPMPPVTLSDTEHERIRATVEAELIKRLTPVVIAPSTCEVTITSVLADYAGGDYRYQIRYPKACGVMKLPTATKLGVLIGK